MRRLPYSFFVILLALFAFNIASAQDTDNTTQLEMKYADIGQQALDMHWNASRTEDDVIALEEDLFASNYRVHSNFYIGVYDFPNGTLAQHQYSNLFVRAPDMHPIIEDVFVSEHAVTVIAHVEATVERPLSFGRSGFYIPASDEVMTWEVIAVYHINDDNLIDEAWFFADMPMLEKLG